MSWSGGCQCGAVRFRVEGELGRASLCHCRMCQKAFAAPFGALVSAPRAKVAWTRGEPARFQSSNTVRRGFCSACGTPLTFEWSDKVVDLAICAFDRAAEITPVVQLARDAALPWIDHVGTLAEPAPAEQPRLAAHYAQIISRQHPDHDTDAWSPPAA